MESSTRKVVVDPEVGVSGDSNCTSGFLGQTNYYSSYVHNYAALAAPLMGKLQVNRLDGKNGSLKPVAWDDESRAAFEALKEALKEGLQVFQLEPDQPFVLRTDASDFAIGAVLEQERKWGMGASIIFQ